MRSVQDIINSQGSPWKTEGAFWSWLRGGLRRGIWEKSPVKLSYIKENRIKVPLGRETKGNPAGMVWGGQCKNCGELFRQCEMEVDHVQRASQKPIKEDLIGFIRGLAFVTHEDLSLICKTCHRTKSYAEREGKSFEEAKAIKLAIAACKQPTSDQVKELTDFGYDASMLTNAKKRRQCYEHYYSSN